MFFMLKHSKSSHFSPSMDPASQEVVRLATQTMFEYGMLTIVLAMVPAGLALVASALQTGFLWTTEPLVPDPGRLLPQRGFSKLMSVRALARGGTTLVAASGVLGVAGWFILRRTLVMDFASGWTTAHLVRWGWEAAMFLAIAIASVLICVGIVDYLYQRWQHTQDLMMTKQEVRDEYKREEGDPQLKARIRRLQRETSQRRALDAVDDATVVVRNPTHYAVALKYERDSMATPQVVASGTDHMALRIIRRAEEKGIHVIENRPLARALYSMVPVGQEIPYELFQAVAEIMAEVYRLDRNMRPRRQRAA